MGVSGSSKRSQWLDVVMFDDEESSWGYLQNRWKNLSREVILSRAVWKSRVKFWRSGNVHHARKKMFVKASYNHRWFVFLMSEGLEVDRGFLLNYSVSARHAVSSWGADEESPEACPPWRPSIRDFTRKFI